MNENINLVELLKDCPEGTRMYSTIFGKDTFFVDVNLHKAPLPITIRGKHESQQFHLSTYGHPFSDAYGECCLWPSEDQRDWSKWECPKQKFDPYTLQPFDRVLFKTSSCIWNCAIVSHVEALRIYLITGGYVYNCIPYNNDTIHLVGTTEEAPEYYRYWEE